MPGCNLHFVDSLSQMPPPGSMPHYEFYTPLFVATLAHHNLHMHCSYNCLGRTSHELKLSKKKACRGPKMQPKDVGDSHTQKGLNFGAVTGVNQHPMCRRLARQRLNCSFVPGYNSAGQVPQGYIKHIGLPFG